MVREIRPEGGPDMGAAENQELVCRMFEKGVNAKDLSAFDEFLADSYVNYDMPAPEPGPAGMKAVMGQFFAAFPDMRVVIDQSVGEGDIVCTRGHFEGTHDGEFMGIPATGKKVTVEYMDMWRLDGGKAVENWVRLDMLGLMQQLGGVPSP
jgi:predicted ester cyclase